MAQEKRVETPVRIRKIEIDAIGKCTKYAFK